MMVCDFLLSQRAFAPPALAGNEHRAVQTMLGDVSLRTWSRDGADLVEQVQRDGWTYWLFGELFGQYRSLADALSASTAQDELGWPPLNVAELNGSFLVLARQERSGEWHAWTDRFGTLHAYWGRRAGQPLIGTRFSDLAAGSGSDLDWQGIVGFLGFGFFPGERTYREDVRIMRPASHYVFDAQLCYKSEQRYWNWSYAPDQRRTYAETVDAFAQCFDQAVEERYERGRTAIPISGGLDSRSTVALVRDQPWRKNLWCYTYGYSDSSIESTIGRQVAACRDLPCDSLTIRPYLFEQWRQVLAGVEGFQDVTQCRQAAVTDAISAHAEFVMAAHWGDVWLDDMGVAEKLAAPNDDELAKFAHDKIKKRGSAWLMKHVAIAQVPESDRSEMLRQFVRDEFCRLPHIEDSEFRVKAFKTDQWSFRWTTASLRAYHAGAFPRTPFYDTRLADLFCTVPTQFVANRRLQVDYLKRCAPDLAGVTWQQHGRNLFDYKRPDAFRLVKRAWNKAAAVATRKQVTQRNWEVQFSGAAGRAGVAHWLQRRGLRLHEYVAPDHIDALVSDFNSRRPDGAIGYTMCMLVTLSMWLESYG
ncbi:MAG: hypothetical protein SGJ19_01810 [Planctomycetia bacterium]|nr:hypothetical protein [Planctomycetia bacterium]